MCFSRFPYALVIIVMLMTASCVRLTPAGARVHIVKSADTSVLGQCRILGRVKVSSEDALRNATADLSGDTALMERQEFGNSFYLRGTIYRCDPSDTTLQPVASVHQKNREEKGARDEEAHPEPAIQVVQGNQQAEEGSTGEPRQQSKASRCSQLGGRWTGELCVIDLD